MTRKLFSFALIFILSASFAVAQSTDNSKPSFAILVGGNFQNLNGKDSNGDKLENDMIPGFHAGFNIQMPIAPEFYFQPGLLFSTKGAKYTAGSLTNTTKLSYVEMPLNLVYKGLLGRGFFLLGFGPYLAYAIKGKVIMEDGSGSSDIDIEFKNVVETGDPAVPYFKAFDAGGNIFAGYEFAGGLFFQLNSQLGMLKINPEDKRITSDETSIKNTGFGLSLGLRF